jgi:hypothetical protein
MTAWWRCLTLLQGSQPCWELRCSASGTPLSTLQASPLLIETHAVLSHSTMLVLGRVAMHRVAPSPAGCHQLFVLHLLHQSPTIMSSMHDRPFCHTGAAGVAYVARYTSQMHRRMVRARLAFHVSAASHARSQKHSTTAVSQPSAFEIPTSCAEGPAACHCCSARHPQAVTPKIL